MPECKVVIVGGGPIGLLCAIEARKYFKLVTIIEHREEYIRMNVPIVQEGLPLRKHLQEVDTEKKIKFRDASVGAPFNKIESVLMGKVASNGIIVYRPFRLIGLWGSSEKNEGRYKEISLSLQAWNSHEKKPLEVPPVTIKADLLIIATGAGAVRDDLVTRTLGFNYERLESKNYMVLGIFEPMDPENAFQVEKELSNIVDKMSGEGGICFDVGDYQYFLRNVSAVTPQDFKLLKQSQDLLRQLVISLKRGIDMTSGAIETIKDVEQNLFAFTVDIQRARQLFSDEYPAVLVGDAAVTPHPDQGSGLESGFRGFQVVKVLLQALKKTASDPLAFKSFGLRYEIAVADKALEGTQTICRNNVWMLETFRQEMKKLAERLEGNYTKEAFDHDVKMADTLIKILKTHERIAKCYQEIVNDKTAGIDTWPIWDQGPRQLWQRMGRTWNLIEQLTKEKPMLASQLKALGEAIEAAEKAKKVTSIT